MSWADDILKQVEGYGGSLKDNAPMLAILALMGKYMDAQNKKDLGNPYKAGKEYLIDKIKGTESNLTQAASGVTPDPMVGRMRGALESRANQTFTPPAVTPPARYNPYATNKTQGQVNPELMTKMMGLIGQQGPTVKSGMNTLTNSMQNRFTPRPMMSAKPNITMPTPQGVPPSGITGPADTGGTTGRIPVLGPYKTPNDEGAKLIEFLKMMMVTGGGSM